MKCHAWLRTRELGLIYFRIVSHSSIFHEKFTSKCVLDSIVCCSNFAFETCIYFKPMATMRVCNATRNGVGVLTQSMAE